MTEAPAEALRFSVIVASLERPDWLQRCLRGVGQLDYPAFEIVVVADEASLSRIDGTGIKLVPFSEPNLARARNIGIAEAGGDICVFIDDDAVPEPMWLAHFADAFRRTESDAAVGYVRGRNGITFQSQVASVDADAETHREPSVSEPCVPDIQPGRALKLVGTNMAIRREIFAKLGGFDEMYRYFLEDTDFSLRLSAEGLRVAVAPLAEVHHAYAASPRRSKQRTPRDLFDIGRSTAIFLRRHLKREYDSLFEKVLKRERQRLLRHMVNGTCEPHDVERILSSLKAGWREGMETFLEEIPVIKGLRSFDAYTNRAKGHTVIASRMLLRRGAAMRRARRIAETGGRISLVSLSLTPFRHRLRYTSDGIWLQTGGQFGRSIRNRSIFRWCRYVERVNEEIRRVANVRGIGEKEAGKRWDRSHGDV